MGRTNRVGNDEGVGDGRGRQIGVDGYPRSAQAAGLLEDLMRGLSAYPLQSDIAIGGLDVGELQH